VTSFGRKGVVESTLPLPMNRSMSAAAQDVVSPSLQYDVTLHPMAMLLGVMAGLAGAMVCFKGLQDPRGLLINRVIELDPGSANVFWGALIVASLGFAVLAAVRFVQSFGERVFITLDSHAISGPTSDYGLRTARIEYRSIQNVRVLAMRGQESVVISATDGRKIKVGQWRFRVSAQWMDFQRELCSRVGGR